MNLSKKKFGRIRLTIFVEQVNDNGYEGEGQVEEKELLEDNLVVQVAESHRLENVTFFCVFLSNLFEDQHM